MNEWVWSNGGMILTGENWSTGWKTLYTVGGRWMSVEQWWNDTYRGKLKYWEKNIIQSGWRMNEYGAMVEWYWQGKTEVVGEKHYTVWVVDEWVWSNGGMILTGENWSTRREACPGSTVSSKKPTWTGLVLNRGLYGPEVKSFHV